MDDGADVETAEVIQGLIRHIEYASNADVAYDTAVHCAAAIGFGYFRLVTDYVGPDSFDQEIKFQRVRNPFTVYMDPASQEPDGSDARFAILTTEAPKEEFKRHYPDATASASSIHVGTGDAMRMWIGDDFVRVAEYYRIERKTAQLVRLVDGSSAWADASTLTVSRTPPSAETTLNAPVYANRLSTRAPFASSAMRRRFSRWSRKSPVSK